MKNHGHRAEWAKYLCVAYHEGQGFDGPEGLPARLMVYMYSIAVNSLRCSACLTMYACVLYIIYLFLLIDFFICFILYLFVVISLDCFIILFHQIIVTCFASSIWYPDQLLIDLPHYKSEVIFAH